MHTKVKIRIYIPKAIHSYHLCISGTATIYFILVAHYSNKHPGG